MDLLSEPESEDQDGEQSAQVLNKMMPYIGDLFLVTTGRRSAMQIT